MFILRQGNMHSVTTRLVWNKVFYQAEENVQFRERLKVAKVRLKVTEELENSHQPFSP